MQAALREQSRKILRGAIAARQSVGTSLALLRKPSPGQRQPVVGILLVIMTAESGTHAPVPRFSEAKAVEHWQRGRAIVA